MASLTLHLPEGERELIEGGVHYLLWDSDGLRVGGEAAGEAGARQLGFFASILGTWYFHADNVPAARVLRIDGRPITNVRQRLGAGGATVHLLAGTHTGPASPRGPVKREDRDGKSPGQAPGPSQPQRTDEPKDGPKYVIGRRGTRADIQIDDPLVRANHATVRVDSKGRWWIAGEVHVGGVRQMSATLSVGDVFVVGQTAVTVTPDLLPRAGQRVPAPPAGPRPMPVGAHRRPSTETGLAVELTGVTAYGDNGRKLLDDVTLSIAHQEVVAVVGPSGAGKSSLIKVLTGELTEASGTVHIGPRTHGGTDSALRRKQVRYVPQADALYDRLTVRETLTYAAQLRAASDSARREIADRVDNVLQRLALDQPKALSEQIVGTLSGGQRRRVSIGLELVGNPQLLLLDEPTSGLDPGKDRAIMADLRQVSEAYRCTVIVVTHSTEHLGYADKVVVLAKGGRVRYVGPPAEVLSTLGYQSWADLMIHLDRTVDEPPERPAAPPVQPRGRWHLDTPLASLLKGLPTLLARQVKLTTRRGRASLTTLVAVPLVCTFVAIISSANGLRPGPDMAQVLAIVVTVTALTGASLTYLDLVHESEILRRDWRVGIAALPILVSKALVFSGVSAVLALVVGVTFAAFRDLPDPAFSVSPLPMLLAVCFLTMLASMGIGLLISAWSPSLERAVTWSTLLAVLQVALSGSLFKLKWGLQVVTTLLPARAGLAAIASYADLNRYRPPALHEDWLWEHRSVAFWCLLLVLTLTFIATTAAAVARMERRWRA